jgi:hypothetical protein
VHVLVAQVKAHYALLLSKLQENPRSDRKVSIAASEEQMNAEISE